MIKTLIIKTDKGELIFDENTLQEYCLQSFPGISIKYKKNPYKGKLIFDEYTLQQYCLALFKAIYGDFQQDKTKPMIIHIANETPKRTSFGYHNKMKKQGKISGIPDIMIISKNKVFFIELKAQDGTIGATQLYIKDCFNYHDINYFVCKTELDFLEVCNKEIQEI